MVTVSLIITIIIGRIRLTKQKTSAKVTKPDKGNKRKKESIKRQLQCKLNDKHNIKNKATTKLLIKKKHPHL